MANIYADGRGLGMTNLVLQKLTGASWTNSLKYDQNQKHRFRARFQSFYSDRIPSNNPACATSDIHVADLRVQIKLPGAVFDGWGQDSGIWALMPGKVENHPNFNDTIKPNTSRWFEFAPFTWKKPDASVSSVLVQFNTFHREIMHYPFAPIANLIASSS